MKINYGHFIYVNYYHIIKINYGRFIKVKDNRGGRRFCNNGRVNYPFFSAGLNLLRFGAKLSIYSTD